MKESQERENIRNYLLGTLIDDQLLQDIERRLMTDDAFAEQVAIYEDELIDDYLEGRLGEHEQRNFENHFLISPEMQERLQFARTFKAFLADQKTAVRTKDEKRGFFNWLPQFLPAPAFAGLVILVMCGILFGAWFSFFHQSDVDKGLIALRQAYAGKRPFESRITDFDYAPLAQVRGSGEDQADKLARDRAERYLLDAVAENKSSASLSALGKFYLAEKNFEKAIDYFEQAIQLSPNDARLQSDMGAALLERGKKASGGDNAESLKLLNESLRHLEKAIELNPALPEPRFNRALCLEAVYLPTQAKAAWLEYLRLDHDSKWREEATRRLQLLESQKTLELSGDEIERAFLNAFRQRDDYQAWQLLSRNREPIKEKYLPQRFAMAVAEADPAQREEYLQALIYAGNLEQKHIGDLLAADIAQFYTKASKAEMELIKQAQDSVRKGYKLCLAGEFSQALQEFKRANTLFLQANNIWEAKLAESHIAYCLYNTDQRKDSLLLFEQIAEFGKSGNYKWLLSDTLYWLAGAQRTTDQRAKARINYKSSLALAEEIGDSSLSQKILMSLAKQANFLGQTDITLNHLQKVFREAYTPGASLRQKWRNFSDGVEILADRKLYSLAQSIAAENISLAENLNDPLFVIYSQIDAGTIHTQAGDLPEARKWLIEAKRSAEKVSEEAERKSLLAQCLIKLGHLDKRLGNYLQAAEFYNQALALVENIHTPYLLYEVQKNRLLTSLSLNNDAEVEKQIPVTLDLMEKYRQQILEEQERTSFFDNEQNIYDIAVANEFNHARYEQAYNYLEVSNSRSLLDWLQKGASLKEDKKGIEISLREATKPFQLAEIRAKMPARVQILQYSVLADKVLIWLVSKEDFAVIPVRIESEILHEKINRYLELLTTNNEIKQRDAEILARELYDVLIRPVSDRLDSSREICLIPHKSLFHLPFAALMSPNGKPFLVEHTFFYAPSANVFLFCSENAGQKKHFNDEALLSIGNPSFDREEFEGLSNLPDAEAEARDIARFYPDRKILLGDGATKTVILQSLGNTEILHIAGHYAVKRGSPLLSSLLLAKTGKEPKDGVLTNAELLREKLSRTKLVVLSACQTGVERYYNGEGFSGLSRTFLAIGAPLVVASQWQVESEATAELMRKFHFYRRQEKLSTTAALRRAQLEMLEASDKRFRHPYFWAAFAVFGGHASF